MLLGGTSPSTADAPGVLEIKCPYNKGNPEEMRPWAVPPAYYVPQIQGLMEVFDREWLHLLCWTPNHGGKVWRFKRDRAYWELCYEGLAAFWWQNVVPAKLEQARGGEVGRYAPSEDAGGSSGRRLREAQLYANKIVTNDIETVGKWE